MGRWLVLLLIIAAAWYGYQWHQEGGRLPRLDTVRIGDFALRDWLPDSTSGVSGETPSVQGQPLKCITAEGRVYYGDVPEGVVCERRETVKGAVVVMPKEDFIGAGKNSAVRDSGSESGDSDARRASPPAP